jgi:hypothetical protein
MAEQYGRVTRTPLGRNRYGSTAAGPAKKTITVDEWERQLVATRVRKEDLVRTSSHVRTTIRSCEVPCAALLHCHWSSTLSTQLFASPSACIQIAAPTSFQSVTPVPLDAAERASPQLPGH